MVFAMFMIVIQFQSEVVLHQRSFKPLLRPESIKRVRDEDGDDDDNNNSSLPNYPPFKHGYSYQNDTQTDL